MIDLAPQHVRIFVEQRWWTKSEVDPRTRLSALRAIDLAGRAGATVNVTMWRGPYLPDEESWAREMAEVLQDILVTRQMKQVRYVTLQNEINLTKIGMVSYNRLYRAFDRILRQRGLRDKIQIIGGDLVGQDQEKWFATLAENQRDILDGYSVHMYANFWDPEYLLKRLTSVPEVISQLPPEARKPVYIMEFGTRGHRKHTGDEPGLFSDCRLLMDVPEGQLLNARLMLEAINRGYYAAVQWDLCDLCYDRSRMYYGLIGTPADGFPLKPGYHLMRMLTHAMHAGAQSLYVQSGAPGGVCVAAMNDSGHVVLFALNANSSSESVSVDGLPSRSTFDQHIWNGAGDGLISSGDAISTDAAGRLAFIASPHSVIAFRN